MINLKERLSRDNIFIGLLGKTKREIIEEMVDRLVATGSLENKEPALKAIMERENQMSTGMQNGIAIPHCRADFLKEFIAAIGISRHGVEFDSLDGVPSKIFIMTFSPAKRTGPHIQFLSQLTQAIDDERIRERVCAAETPEEVLRLLGAD